MLVAAAVARFGVDDLLLTVIMSGIMMTLIGFSRLGQLIRHIPHPVTVGFTAGIAVTILASQIRDFAGLRLAGPEPGPIGPKLVALADALPSLSPATLAVGAGAAALIFLIRRFRPTWPAMLIAVAVASLAAIGLGLPVETIGSRFGDIPHGLAAPRLPPVSLPRLLSCFRRRFPSLCSAGSRACFRPRSPTA